MRCGSPAPAPSGGQALGRRATSRGSVSAFVAGGVGEGPPGGGEVVEDHVTAGGEAGLDAGLGLVVGYPDPDVDGPSPIGAGLLHGFEPEARQAVARVDQVLVGRVG